MSTFYKIGEIAALYGISTDILRYYEELGILVPAGRPTATACTAPRTCGASMSSAT